MNLVTIANSLIDHFGYVGLFLAVMINAIGIPFPAELTLGLAGVGVNEGKLAFVPVIVLGTLGLTIGLCISYAIARLGGITLVERYGKYVLIRKKDLDHVEESFEKYGGRIVFFGMLLPGLHGYLGYPAGVAKYSFAKFLAAAVITSLAWSLVMGSVGYYLGSKLTIIDAWLRSFGLILIFAVIVLAVVWYLRRRKNETTTNHAT